MHTFTASWTSWEMQPTGEELVICVAGVLTLVQAINGVEQRSTLHAGQVAINPRGVWHTADVPAGSSATALFVTPGLGTDGRPRRD